MSRYIPETKIQLVQNTGEMLCFTLQSLEMKILKKILTVQQI